MATDTATPSMNSSRTRTAFEGLIEEQASLFRNTIDRNATLEARVEELGAPLLFTQDWILTDIIFRARAECVEACDGECRKRCQSAAAAGRSDRES